MNKTLTAIILALMLLVGQLQAATLQQIVIPFAVPIDSIREGPQWSSINTIEGVLWAHRGLREIVRGEFSRYGKIRLCDRGAALVFFFGSKTAVSRILISIGQEDGKIFEKEDFDRLVHSQFDPKAASIRLIRGGCEDEGIVSGTALYEIMLKGKKPIYLLIDTDAGGSAPNSRGSYFEFSRRIEERWECTH